MDWQVLTRELSLYLESQVRVGLFGSGVGLSLVLGFGVAYACYYLSSIAKKPQLVASNDRFCRFLEEYCPVVTETYYPTIWCWEGRVQTLLRPFITARPQVQYRNELIKTADGGQISLDWFDNNDSLYYPDASTRPTVLLLPGLTGTSKESYILHMIHQSETLGYRCVVFNNRGIAGEDLLTPRTYCAANTEDLEAVIHHVHSLHPSAPFMAAGVSMGGMLLLNYLGKTGRDTPLMAAAIFSAGWNVFESVESLEKPLNWLLFNYYLTTCLQSSISRHRQMLEKLFDMDLVMKAPFRYWKAALRSPRSLLFSRLNIPNSLSLSSQERCSSPLIILVALLWTHSNRSMSFSCRGLQSWTQYSSYTSRNCQTKCQRCFGPDFMRRPYWFSGRNMAKEVHLHGQSLQAVRASYVRAWKQNL
ncbi:phospholipase ABHD3 isoform X5 [Chroicocephalus ridibundus]|uniref:phospholipase ABHD3 isoform X5 n=1 Tax=Chroicocephalus ridibundus TaxID=1192867 RepID=UPI002FDE5867